jgi:hypothetical protein
VVSWFQFVAQTQHLGNKIFGNENQNSLHNNFYLFYVELNYKLQKLLDQMPDGHKFQSCQIRKPNCTSPCYILTSYPMLEFIHLTK